MFVNLELHTKIMYNPVNIWFYNHSIRKGQNEVCNKKKKKIKIKN